jgi:hypothetical protein
MLGTDILTTIVQLSHLSDWCSIASDIYSTFSLPLGSYALLSMIRAGLGFGNLGRAIYSGRVSRED